MSVKLEVTLDKRRAKKSTGTYPVVLLARIDSNPYRYPTKFKLTSEDFEKLSAKHLNEKLQEIKSKLRTIQKDADAYLEDNFDFEKVKFENEFICRHPLFKPRKQKQAISQQSANDFDFTPYLEKFPLFAEDHSKPGCISLQYLKYVKKLIRERRIGSAFAYQESYNSLKRFRGNVPFRDITPTYLTEYEYWQTDRGRTLTTVGIRLRALRTMFNEAIHEGLVNGKDYPFGKRKYVIPTGRNIKKALTREQVSKIYYHVPESEDVKRGKDYWMFCYFGNGMNPKDVAYLRFRDMQNEFLIFLRTKTQRTSRKDPKPITAFITEEMKAIIARLGNPGDNPDKYIFPILDETSNPLEQHIRVKEFIRFINRSMVVVCADLGINSKVSTVVSRHSKATHLKRAGATTEFIQETLGHADKNTTENYLDSFENDVKKEFAQRLSFAL
jgi:integrase/recombinase XerD